MTRGGWIVLLGLVCLLAAGSFALVRLLEPSKSDENVSAGDAALASSARTTGAAELELATDADATPSVREARAATTSREDVVDDSELADAHWVEGRVVFPEGTPLDEELRVVARGRNFEKRALHSVKVGADGHFRVAFSKKTKQGRLALEAHYLYLRESISVHPAAPPAALVLEPLLGGRIRGTCAVPFGRADLLERARGARVHAAGRNRVGSNDRQERGSELDANLAFDLGGLDPNSTFRLSIQPERMSATVREEVDVQAGETVTLEFALVEGARVAGVVVDEQGAPVGRASIGTSAAAYSIWREDGTDAKTGAFELTGIAPGRTTLSARKTGYTEKEHDLGELREGDVREGLRIVLERGATIQGRVQWPDGTPAAGAIVRVELEDPEAKPLPSKDGFRSGEDGAFEIAGIVAGAHKLRATARRPEAVPTKATVDAAAPTSSTSESDRPTSKKTPRARGPMWSAELSGVQAGSSGVVLVLAEGHAVTGLVVDDSGAPVPAFSIAAIPVGKEEWDRDFSRRESRTVRSADGRYELNGLTAGQWELRAHVKDIGSEPVIVEVPSSDEAPRLVVARAGVVRGRVVDAAGRPVPRARVQRVELRPNGGGMRQVEVGSHAGTQWARCDEAGEFEMDGVPHGSVTLVARADGAAESAPVTAVSVLAAPVSITIVLRAGGTIRGIAFGGDGRPEGGRRVIAWNEAGEAVRPWTGTTDASGRFAIEHVAPGRWRVSPEASITESRSKDFDWAELHSRSRTVTVAEGETVDVQLGGVEKDSVVLRGRVTRGGKSVGGVSIQGWFLGAGSAEDQRSAASKSKESGDYELTLPKPGKWRISFSSPNGAALARQVDVAAGRAMPLDVELPLGVLRGRVVDRDGGPVVGLQVMVSPDTGVARDDRDTSHGNSETDGDGRFAFEGLAPGTYAVGAGVWGGVRRDLAGGVRRGCVVPESGAGPEVVIVLDRAGSLLATVLGLDGARLQGASVRVAPVDAPENREGSRAESNTQGRATVESLTPGAYLVAASHGDAVTTESVRVVVRSGERAEVQLTLGRGGTIVATAIDSDGKRVGAWCVITDARGADWMQLVNVQWGRPGQEGVRYGPLPPGRYRVSSKNKDGVEASAEAVVTAGGEARVELRFATGPR